MKKTKKEKRVKLGWLCNYCTTEFHNGGVKFENLRFCTHSCLENYKEDVRMERYKDGISISDGN